MHGSAVGVQGLEAETLRRSEQPMRSAWAQVQGPEAETLQEFSFSGNCTTGKKGGRNRKADLQR